MKRRNSPANRLFGFDSFEQIRLLTFKFQVAMFVFVGKIDVQMQMTAVNAGVGGNLLRADAEGGFPDGNFKRLKKDILPAVFVKNFSFD